jgi:predicted P-loop ATPase
VVLIGGEGIGKSSSIKALVPDRRLFSDSLPLGQDPKQTVEKTEGVWICESAELVGNTPAKINEIKAFLSRQEDGPFRAAWGIESTVRPRQFIPIATNNDPLFLNSLHGNRRFWPVRVWHCSHEKLAVDRDQIWAEVAKREAEGESILLPKALWEEAGKQQEDYRATDPWEDTLANLPFEINVNALYARLSIPTDRRTPKDGQRLAAIMLKKGYKRERKQVDREKITVYRLLTPFDEEKMDHDPENAPIEYDDEEIEHDVEQDYLNKMAMYEEEEQS